MQREHLHAAVSMDGVRPAAAQTLQGDGLASAAVAEPITSEALPAVRAVRDAVEALHIAQGWLIETQTIVWFDDDGASRQLCVASSDIANPAVQEAAEQWHAEAPRCFHADAQALRPYFAELGAEPDRTTATARAHALSLRELAEEAPVVAFVDAMLAEASERRASDVHIEPFEDELKVRFRIDGLLVLWRTVPRGLFDAVSSRIKILSGMDIAERRLPQDGRQSLRLGQRTVDARVSSLPTTWGESIVIRFLGKESNLPTLAQLGLDDNQRARIEDMAATTSGLLLVTGPTGSGKTTTIYRLITNANDGVRKIVSVEDPVEIDLPGVLQTPVRPEIGLDFASGLRSILRQDPDVIMVGEIRDAETASIAVQAALTGHLVISTLHTTSAIAAVSRLLDLGVESYFIADVLRGLVGQRLVRRLCPHCCLPAQDPDAEAFACAHLAPGDREAPPAWRRPAGCPRCTMTGFLGRTALFETAVITPDLRTAIRQRADEAALEALCRQSGFKTVLQDGLIKARSGLTTLPEVQRVIGGPRI